MLLEGKNVVERGGAADELLQPVAQGDVAAQPRLEIGVLVGDVGTGELAPPLPTQPGNAVHDAVELRRGDAALDLHVAVTTPARALEVATRLLDHALYVPARYGGRVDHDHLLPGANRHAVHGGRGRDDWFG